MCIQFDERLKKDCGDDDREPVGQDKPKDDSRAGCNSCATTANASDLVVVMIVMMKESERE
jgi:hypothetical protein